MKECALISFRVLRGGEASMLFIGLLAVLLAVPSQASAPPWPDYSFTAGSLQSDAPVPPGFSLPSKKSSRLQEDTLKNGAKKTEKKERAKDINTYQLFLQRFDTVMTGMKKLAEFEDEKKSIFFDDYDLFGKDEGSEDIISSWNGLLIHRRTKNHPEEQLLRLKRYYGAGSPRFQFKKRFLIRGTARIPYVPVENLNGYGYNWQADYEELEYQALMERVQAQSGRYTNQTYLESMFNDREWQRFFGGQEGGVVSSPEGRAVRDFWREPFWRGIK